MGHEVFSFMDGYSGYNQIKMAPEDEEIIEYLKVYSVITLCLSG
jgi:hypothetical protein